MFALGRVVFSAASEKPATSSVPAPGNAEHASLVDCLGRKVGKAWAVAANKERDAKRVAREVV